MPLTEKGNEILGAMQKEYGAKKGEEVFYAAKNAGTISGVDSAELGLEGKSITVLDTMAEQIASLGSEAKRLVDRMDARDPWDEGYADGKKGGSTRNPYMNNSTKAREYHDGWMKAQKDMGK